MPPGTRNALVPPSPNYLRDAGQFVGGVGRGLANQFVVSPLQLVQQSYEDPYSLGQGIYEGARSLAADPVGVVGNSLRGMWNRAKSGPAGLGQVVGENIDPRNLLKPKPQIIEISGYHGTRPEVAKIIQQEGFDLSKHGTGQKFSAQVPGAWFSASPESAKRFGKHVLEAELDLKKPYRIKAASYLQKFLYNAEDPVAFAEKLKAKGYDGLHIKFEPEYEGGYGPSGTEEWGYDNYVVFDPSKIKVK